MKKFFVSTGLAAISVAGLQSAYGQGLDIVSPKAWSVSGTLRGFYDDNYNLGLFRLIKRIRWMSGWIMRSMRIGS
ncbi:MAG: hypothetical protein JF609_04295 [Verrucomicrobia bacterium]|nr:hypothetical protein [Verrucomicrobiota bacterium]